MTQRPRCPFAQDGLHDEAQVTAHAQSTSRTAHQQLSTGTRATPHVAGCIAFALLHCPATQCNAMQCSIRLTCASPGNCPGSCSCSVHFPLQLCDASEAHLGPKASAGALLRPPPQQHVPRPLRSQSSASEPLFLTHFL